jgi:hypothetical protein
LPSDLRKLIDEYANPAGLLRRSLIAEMKKMCEEWVTWLYMQEFDWDNPGELPDRNIGGPFLQLCVQGKIQLA